MSRILLKNVQWNGKNTFVRIEENRFDAISETELDANGAETLDCSGLALLPTFYNGHTHAAMTLLRSYADDLELFAWLNDHIWPAEALMCDEDIYWGTKLAILEMIRSGTVFFNDMYYGQKEVIRAAGEMGVRAAVGMLQLSAAPEAVRRKMLETNAELLANRHSYSELITITTAPHAVYTVDAMRLREISEQARDNDLMIHIHASETAQEVKDCLTAHGMTPIDYLRSLGLLTPKTILAHAVHLTDADIGMIEDSDAVIAHMPCSNMKLVSGQFQFRNCCEKHNCRLTIGTDGASSNNSLSMLNEMKFAALSGKIQAGDPTTASALRVFDAATRGGASAFGIDAGLIETGRLADCILVDLHSPELACGHHLINDMVYAANPACIDTVICNGRILMRHGRVPGSEEIVAHAAECCAKLRERCRKK